MVWTLVSDSPSPNRVFTRPLDDNEVGFFYDGTFNGVADMAEHYMVQTTRDSLFELANVARTWIALKRIFPLLGATTRETDYETTSASFAVAEADLGVTRPGEIVLLTATSEAEVHEFVEQLISGPRQLSPNLLSRVYIFSRGDNLGMYHVVIHIAHLITDGMSALALVRTFFDILSLPPAAHVSDFEARLALCVGSENLNPNRNLPLARRRWRRAIGWVIRHIRDLKIQVRLPLTHPSSMLTGFTGWHVYPTQTHDVYALSSSTTEETGNDAHRGRVGSRHYQLQKTRHNLRSCVTHFGTVGQRSPPPSKVHPR